MSDYGKLTSADPATPLQFSVVIGQNGQDVQTKI